MVIYLSNISVCGLYPTRNHPGPLDYRPTGRIVSDISKQISHTPGSYQGYAHLAPRAPAPAGGLRPGAPSRVGPTIS